MLFSTKGCTLLANYLHERHRTWRQLAISVGCTLLLIQIDESSRGSKLLWTAAVIFGAICCMLYVTRLFTLYQLRNVKRDIWITTIHDELVAMINNLSADRAISQKGNKVTYRRCDKTGKVSITRLPQYYRCIVSSSEFEAYDVTTSLETRTTNTQEYIIPLTLLGGPAVVSYTSGTLTVSKGREGGNTCLEEINFDESSPKEAVSAAQLWDLLLLIRSAAM